MRNSVAPAPAPIRSSIPREASDPFNIHNNNEPIQPVLCTPVPLKKAPTADAAVQTGKEKWRRKRGVFRIELPGPKARTKEVFSFPAEISSTTPGYLRYLLRTYDVRVVDRKQSEGDEDEYYPQKDDPEPDVCCCGCFRCISICGYFTPQRKRKRTKVIHSSEEDEKASIERNQSDSDWR